MIPGKVLVPVVLVVMAVVTVVVIVVVKKDDTHATAGSPSTSSAPVPLTAAEASRLADDVTSGDEKRVRAAVAVSPEQPLDAAAVSGLATIESMVFDVRTFRDHGNGTAEVTAQVVMRGGAQPTVWKVRLVTADRQWLISSTEPGQ